MRVHRIMKTNSWMCSLAMPIVGASLSVFATGCAGDKPPPPAQSPVITSAELRTPPRPAPAVVAVAPNVNVSEELAAACKLRFNDPSTAPKFGFDQSQLGADDTDVLAQIAECVSTGPLAGRGLYLVGRADPRGEGEYNMALGDRRATSVRDYLSGRGVEASNLSMSSRGEIDATGTDESGWQRDRRDDILLR